MTGKNVQDIEQRMICSACIGDDFLRHAIKKSGRVKTCYYCGDDGRTTSMEDLANRVEEAFHSHYRRTDAKPSSWEYGLMKEGIIEWEREGDSVVDVIRAMGDVSEDVAMDTQRILSNRYFDLESAKMGEELPFSEDQHYAESEPDDSDHQVNWSNFEFSLKTESKYSVYRCWTHPEQCDRDEVWEGSGGARMAARQRAGVSWRSCGARYWNSAGRRAITAECMARR